VCGHYAIDPSSESFRSPAVCIEKLDSGLERAWITNFNVHAQPFREQTCIIQRETKLCA